jgi:hypothetical protein
MVRKLLQPFQQPSRQLMIFQVSVLVHIRCSAAITFSYEAGLSFRSLIVMAMPSSSKGIHSYAVFHSTFEMLSASLRGWLSAGGGALMRQCMRPDASDSKNVWRPCMYGVNVCMASMYAWRPCMYGFNVCMASMYAWRQCLYGVNVCMVSMYVWRQCMHGPGSRVAQAERRVASSFPPAAAVTKERERRERVRREREMPQLTAARTRRPARPTALVHHQCTSARFWQTQTRKIEIDR